MLLAGLDIGTTGCKITVYDEDGTYQYRSYCDYPVSRHTGVHEVKAEYILDGVKKVISDTGKLYPHIGAIGITSFGESCVLLDADDQPIRPIMLYTDPRGQEECQELIKRLGRETIERVTGISPHSMYSLPKVMWIKKHHPREYKKVCHILMMEDFITYMLTGNAVIDFSLATRSMAFDIRKLGWSSEIFEAAGIEPDLFSTPAISGTNAGKVKKDIAMELGISDETVIVPVGHDQVAAAIGSGVFEADSAVDGAGTVECITPVYNGIPEGRKMYEGNYAVVPYVIPGKYVTYAFSFTGGALVSWFVNHLAKGEQYQAKEQGKSVYDILEEGMKDAPTGILVLPHFAGAATPYMDEGSKGAIVGLTIEHNASDLYRAIMEGVGYEMMLNIDCLKQAGISPKKLRATGGGALSKAWMQMKADMLNMPITALESAEAGATGCAMMAGIAVGRFKDLEEAARVMIQEKETYYPRELKHQIYKKYYANYKKLYGAVRPLV